MKNKDEFLKQMETLQIPEVDPALHQQKVKMTIMNAERSAALSVWLLVTPCYFLFCVLMSDHFHSRALDHWLVGMILGGFDNKWLSLLERVLFSGLPFVSVIINALAILNIQYHKLKPMYGKANELSITIKLKFWNIFLLLFSLCLVYFFVS